MKKKRKQYENRMPLGLKIFITLFYIGFMAVLVWLVVKMG